MNYSVHLAVKQNVVQFEISSYPCFPIMAEQNKCLPAGLGLHVAGNCEGCLSSALLSIFHHETPTAPGGLSPVYYYSPFLSLFLTAVQTVMKAGQK